MKILITGANGFLGSHLCLLGAALKDDLVVAAVRNGSNLSNIESIEGLQIRPIDFAAEAQLTQSLRSLQEEFGVFDVVIHNAGLTKSTDQEAFYKINLGLTKILISSIGKINFLNAEGKFVYISSLAALGPYPHKGPVSAYGLSKVLAEEEVKSSGFNYLIFRPTALYGPYDLEFLPLFKAVRWHLYPCLASPRQKITMIHGRDAALNVILALRLYQNETVHLASDQVYSHRDVSLALEQATKTRALFLSIPVFLVKGLLWVVEFVSGLFGRTPVLTLEKYNEISGDWAPDLAEERKSIPLEFNFSLNQGFSDTLAFYKSKKLI